MNPTDQTISVIIPLYNGARFIKQALDSVFAQSLSPIEIIVVNDGSTDNGPEIVAEYSIDHPLILLHQANAGQSAARNLGIRHSTGKLVALLDQDDVWYAYHLEELIAPFLQDPNGQLGWTYSDIDQITENNTLRLRAAFSTVNITHPKTRLDVCLREDMFVLPSSSMISRTAFDAVGGFDERLCGYEDDDLFLRLFVAGFRNVFIARPLAQWRVYAGSTSYSPRMAVSRMIYARKLIDMFPDEPTHLLFYIRDLIAPRFLHLVVKAARDAFRAGDEAAIRTCMADISFLRQYVSTDIIPDKIREDLLITAVIPLYNGGSFIREAIQSILGQSLRPEEIIVVDDGSTDNGPDIVTEMMKTNVIRLIQKENGGQSSARNMGVAHANGDLIAFLDQDDVWYPNHLFELARPFFDNRAIKLGWTYSNLDEINELGEIITRSCLNTLKTVHPKRELSSCLAEDMFVLPSASLISRSAFQAIGGFDEALSGYEDDDLFLRMFQAGFDNVYLPPALSMWRIYQSSSSYTPKMAVSRLVYAKKLIDQFPDDPAQSRYNVRDLIAPRFLHQVVETARDAFRAGDEAAIKSCMDSASLLRRYVTCDSKSDKAREDLIVTAIIPLYNGGPFIRTAIESILAQTLKPDEIIVVDDGSTDDGPDIVIEMMKSNMIRFLRKENGGQSTARNMGVDHAHGDLIAFLDQDDVWYPDHLAELIKPFFDTRPIELGWTYSNLDEINELGEIVTRGFLSTLTAPHPKRELSSCLAADMFVLPSASLVSRRAFQAVGGFDEALSGYEDDDLFLRLFQAGFDNVYLPQSISMWRIYPSSSSYSPKMAVSRLTYFKKLIDQFPDDPSRSRYYVRDLIAPRFLHQCVKSARDAFSADDEVAINNCMETISFFRQYITSETKSDKIRADLIVTAIIPLYNGGPFIRTAIESILAQTLKPDEIIVVDDGSTDDGPDIVIEMMKTNVIRFFRKKNGGQSAARNMGVDHAHGDLIAFLDQDDAWYPNHLAELARPFFETRAIELGWTYSNVDEINESGEMITRGFLATLKAAHPKRDLFSCLKEDMFVLPSASLISRTAFQAVGGFDERLSGYEDDDLFLRLFQAGFDNIYLSQSMSQWRIYQASSSYSPRMAVSRAIYARKLINQYPNDPDRSRYMVRDMVAPRFFLSMAAELRKAILKGTRTQQTVALANLTFISGFLRLGMRLPVRLLLLPALRIRPVAHFIMVHRITLARIARRFF